MTATDLIRFLTELVALVTFGIWGFTQFELPWPGILTGLGAPLFAAVVWALFRSPKAVFRIDSFGKALVEIAIFSAAAMAMLFMGWPWWVVVIYVLVAATSGVITGRRELQRSAG